MTYAKGIEGAVRGAAAAYSAYSAYRSASKTLTKMRNSSNVPVLVEPGEYTRKSRRHGRYRKKTLKNLYRIVSTNQQPNWFRFEGINRFNSNVGGFFTLYNHLNTATNVEYQPLFIADLTSISNLNSTGILQEPIVMWFATRNNLASPVTYSLTTAPGTDSTGASSALWNKENMSGTNGTIVAPARRGILKYSDIRLMCYGCTQLPVKYDISIVYFPDDIYNPFYGSVLNNGTIVSNSGGQSAVLMDDLLAPFSYNPLNVQDPKLRSKCKFLFRESFIIQPGVTTEGDSAVPHFREVKIFKKWDKFCTFDWQDNVNSDPQVTKFMQQAGSTFPTVEYSKRCFLMVRAISGFTSAAGVPTFSKTVNPTFDLFIRNKWMIST